MQKKQYLNFLLRCAKRSKIIDLLGKQDIIISSGSLTVKIWMKYRTKIQNIFLLDSQKMEKK